MKLLVLDDRKLARLTKDKAAVLKELEEKAGVEIFVRRERGESVVEVSGEPAGEWSAEQVLQAISLGFAPKTAFKLLAENNFLEVIDLAMILPNEKAIARHKARIIGTDGKSKKKMEEFSGASIAVNEGSQIGILGEFEDVKSGKEAVTRLLEGSPHGSVFVWLKNDKRRKEAEAMGLNFSKRKSGSF